MSYRDERRADLAAEREQDREDRRLAHEARLQAQREAAEQKRRDEEARAEQKRREAREKERLARQRKADRKAARQALRAKTMANLDTTLALVVMACATGPAFVVQAWAMTTAGAPIALALALAVMLECGAWVATLTGERAKREGRPTGIHRAAMWGCAAAAGGINAWKAPILFPGAAWMPAVLAAASLGGVFFWELRGVGRHKAQGAKTKEQRRAEKAREKHDARRRKSFPAVWKRHQEILAAHPLGALDPEAAWQAAWRDVHGADVGTTASAVAARIAADKALADALAAAERTPEETAVTLLLADLFPTPGGGEEGPGGTPARAPSRGPAPGSPKAATALGRKGIQPSGRTSTKTPDRAPSAEDLDRARAIADEHGAHALSIGKLRRAGVTGADRYLMAVRDSVKAEYGTK